MERDYIARHNSVVPADAAWIDMGDFVFTKRWKQAKTCLPDVRRLVHAMSGKVKMLMCGNHDNMDCELYRTSGFDLAFDKSAELILHAGNLSIRMSHRPPELNKDSQSGVNIQPDIVKDVRASDEVNGGCGKNPMLLLDRSANNPSGPLWDNMLPVREPRICGHVHQLFRLYARGPLVNVGVDVWDGYPVSLKTLLELIEEK